MENEQINVYGDMDGTTALWEEASLEELYTPGFFLQRKPVANVIEFFRALSEMPNVNLYVLSAVVSDQAKQEKIKWNEKYLPFIPKDHQIYPPYGANKAAFIKGLGINISETDVLIDDFTRNCRDWYGIAIKLYNGINGTHGTWTGYSIHHNMKPSLMCYQLLGACTMHIQMKAKKDMVSEHIQKI